MLHSEATLDWSKKKTSEVGPVPAFTLVSLVAFGCEGIQLRKASIRDSLVMETFIALALLIMHFVAQVLYLCAHAHGHAVP